MCIDLLLFLYISGGSRIENGKTRHMTQPEKGWQLTQLPLARELETVAVLKQLSKSHRWLAELKGVAATIPNEQILISTLSIQEARRSSEVESIITTQDDLFRSDSAENYFTSGAAKEVLLYATALREGFNQMRKRRVITLGDILTVQESLVGNHAGLRKVPGTNLIGSAGEIVYTPPQDPKQIEDLMGNLVDYINDDAMDTVDPLIKMAIIHHQFESIHPFYDGNGRTGRILNILYLILQDLLNLPILYMSRYIVDKRSRYYETLQKVRDTGNWEEYILYILEAIEHTSRQTIEQIEGIRRLMQYYKHEMRAKLPRIYSQDLLNSLFRHPYTKIELIEQQLGVSRLTATKYLNALCQIGLLRKNKIGRTNYYINAMLLAIFDPIVPS